MTEVCNFVATLTKARKSQKEIKLLVDAAYSDKALSISQLPPHHQSCEGGRGKTPWTNNPPALRKQSIPVTITATV
jgi:hypothetical protein